MNRVLLAAGIALGCLIASVADAEVITKTYDVRASNFINVEDSLPGPIDEIVGRFAVRFDQDLANIEPTPIGLSVNGFNFDYDGPVSFTVGYETLVIGTSLFPGGFNLDRRPRGFGLIVGLRQDFARFAYSNGVDGIFEAGSLTVTSTTSAVPEPDGWAMMICGFGIIGGVLRRTKVGAKSSSPLCSSAAFRTLRDKNQPFAAQVLGQGLSRTVMRLTIWLRFHSRA